MDAGWNKLGVNWTQVRNNRWKVTQMRITVQLWRLLHPPVATRQKPREGDKRNHKTGNITIRLRGKGTRGGTNTTCIFYIFGLLILRCYIYISICSVGEYNNQYFETYCAKSFDVLIFHKRYSLL